MKEEHLTNEISLRLPELESFKSKRDRDLAIRKIIFAINNLKDSGSAFDLSVTLKSQDTLRVAGFVTTKRTGPKHGKLRVTFSGELRVTVNRELRVTFKRVPAEEQETDSSNPIRILRIPLSKFR